jgi:hypothetical protein
VWIDGAGAVRVIDEFAGIRLRTGANAYSTVSPLGGIRLWGASATDFWALTGDSTNGFVMTHLVNNVATACTGCPTPPLRDLIGTSATNVIGVGNQGRIYRWNGSAVTQMTSGTTQALFVVSASPDGAHVWAGGGNGTLLYLNGATWEPVAFPDQSSPIFAIWGTSPSDLFVGMTARIWHFDGEHWAPVDPDAPGTINELEGFGDAVLYGDSSNAGGGLHHIARLRPW